jgi:hypothetical protein
MEASSEGVGLLRQNRTRMSRRASWAAEIVGNEMNKVDAFC